MNGNRGRSGDPARRQNARPETARHTPSPAGQKNTSKVKRAAKQDRSKKPAAHGAPAPTKAELTEARRREAQQALHESRMRETANARPVPQASRPAAQEKIPPVRPATKAQSAKKTTPAQVRKPKDAPRPQADKNPARPAGKAVKKNAQRPAPERRAARTIHQQTPSIRKEQRKGKKITGSVKNLEVKPHTKTERTRFRVKRQKQSWRVILSRLAMFAVIFAVLFSLFAGFFFIRLKKTSGLASGDYTVQIGENDSKTTVTYTSSAKRAYANGTYNISIDALREYCGFTVTGDARRLRYIPRGSVGQSVAFEIGSNTAWVNGVQVRMEKPCFLSGGNLYVPVSFFDRYAVNLTVQHAPSENKMTVLRTETAESVASTARDKVPEYEPIGFTLSGDAPMDHITEQSVDES